MIDGNAVKPAHPASSPVQSGEIAGDAIVLRSPGLTRRFELIDGVYRLAEASHTTGWVRLTYRNGLIERAASASATVDFKRNADGRVVSVQDTLGRSATYAYDGAGRLASHKDLAGATWQYGYTAAGLATLTNPRGKTVLHATYDAAGRVSWIEVQGRKSTFSYSDKTTRAVDGLNRTTVFHHTKSGVTEAVESPTGTFSQLAFDAAGRPTAVLRDGTNVATLSYYTEGTPASISAAGQTTHFAHDSHGLTRAAGAETARYGYDAVGRLSYATDAGGVRTYAYDAAGFPSRIELGQWKTVLRHDAHCGGVTAITAPIPDPAPLDTASLTAGTRSALACLRTAVTANGGWFALQSAYRSQSYQDHLLEVWNKYQTVECWPSARCRDVQTNVRNEWDRHSLVAKPAEVSNHSNGRAFDATWGRLNAGVSIDDLARGCNLSRPFPVRDPVHFVH